MEPALKVTFANGNREVVLHYVEHQLKNDNLEITLKDEGSPLFVHLHYRVYADSGIIERSARIENRTSDAVTLESAQSAAWTLPPDQVLSTALPHGTLGGRMAAPERKLANRQTCD